MVICLEKWYEWNCNEKHPTNEHLPVLRKYASECASVTELGVSHLKSASAFLLGLSESRLPERSYFGVDCQRPPLEVLSLGKRFAQEAGIAFTFLKADDLELECLAPMDLLFIDSLHTYYHLSYELKTFSPQAKKYILIHDTAPPWGFENDDFHRTNYEAIPTSDCPYGGDYCEYFPNESQSSIDWSKRGLWPAVVDFLDQHPEWTILEHKVNNNGLTVLRRI